MRALLFISLIISTLCACQGKKESKLSFGGDTPERPSVIPGVSAERSVDPLWNHPWLRTQPYITEINEVIRDDLDSIEEVCHALAKQRIKAGFPPVSKEEDRESILQQIQTLQQPISQLGLSYPQQWYSLLNLPHTDSKHYPLPIDFQIHKRVYVDDNQWGMPVFLDLRVFQLDQFFYEERAQEVIQWHSKLLKETEAFFRSYDGKNWTVLLGRGSYNKEHFDPSHGFSSEDRGIFIAYRRDADKLYLLFLDAPRDVFDKHQGTLMSIIR